MTDPKRDSALELVARLRTQLDRVHRVLADERRDMIPPGIVILLAMVEHELAEAVTYIEGEIAA